MKKILLLSFAFLVLSSHDMFFKMDTFFLEPNSPAVLNLYNGTFEKSENVITRDRMIDVSVVGNGILNRIDTSSWTEVDSSITVLHFDAGDAGTWVGGLSTRAKNIELSAEDFNDYLEHDGIIDVLEKRKQDGIIDQPAIEKYSKHVKAIFQVGETKSEDWKTPLGYPIEFIPLVNPYELVIGDELEVQLLRDGQPLANQLVYAGFNDGSQSHDHKAEQEAHHHDETQMRTNENGKVAIKVDHGGHWYIRAIHMITIDEPGLTHESNWATLTFEVAGLGYGHGGVPVLIFWGVGLLFIIGLFLYLRK